MRRPVACETGFIIVYQNSHIIECMHSTPPRGVVFCAMFFILLFSGRGLSFLRDRAESHPFSLTDFSHLGLMQDDFNRTKPHLANGGEDFGFRNEIVVLFGTWLVHLLIGIINKYKEYQLGQLLFQKKFRRQVCERKGPDFRFGNPQSWRAGEGAPRKAGRVCRGGVSEG